MSNEPSPRQDTRRRVVERLMARREEIRELHDEHGVNYAQLGKRFGVGESTIRRVLRGAR